MTYGADATTPGVLSTASRTARQSSTIALFVTVTCGSNPSTLLRNSWSNPVITEITTISTAIPSVTPSTEIRVMMETNVRLGFRYRSARNNPKGSRVARTGAAAGAASEAGAGEGERRSSMRGNVSQHASFCDCGGSRMSALFRQADQLDIISKNLIGQPPSSRILQRCGCKHFHPIIGRSNYTAC